MRWLLGVLLLPTAVFPISMACVDVEATILDRIHAKIQESYPRVNTSGVAVRDISKPIHLACETVEFDLPKALNIANDLVVKLDVITNDVERKRVTKVYRFSGFVNGLKRSMVGHRGEPVLSAHFEAVQVPVHQASYHMVGHVSDGQWQLRNYVHKNDILNEWMLEKLPDARKGDKIVAVVEKNNVQLTLDGQLLENGIIGKDVRFEMNNKIMIGRLHDKKTIIINNI